MKIVYVSDAIYPYNIGGKEKRLYELSTRIAAMGHDVHIYTMHWWKTPETTRVENGVTLHAISRYYPMYKAGGDRRSIKEALLFSLACFKLLGVSFDVLDVDHMPFFPIYTSWIVCRLRGKKLYGTWHEALSRKDWVQYMGPAGNIAALIERVSLHLPDTITAASKHTQLQIKSEFKRTKNVVLVTSGIDIRLIDSLNPAKIVCDVLYSGRLVKDKNVDKLIRAIGILSRRNPAIRCIIIGHGTERRRLQHMIQKRKLEPYIQLLSPLQNAEDLYAYMKASKVFCLPSIREGFGIVALEALGCGTPVVTTNSPANAAKYLIQEGVSGSIVEPLPKYFSRALGYWTTVDKPKHIKGKAAAYDWNSLAAIQTQVYAS